VPLAERIPSEVAAGSLRVSVDADAEHPEWDAFLAGASGGHHAQTSIWARVKAVLGWRATRVLVRDGDRIVAGAQVLMRDVGRVGRVGFCPRGPVLESGAPELVGVVHRALIELGRDERIRYLKIQPPDGSHGLVPALRSHGWTSSAIEAAPTATVRVELNASEDELLARMRATNRRMVRQSLRRGLTIRAGGETDFDTYARIVEATSRRQGFVAYPAAYYRVMWRLFADEAMATLLLAELDGEVLSSALLVGFGDTVTYKMGGWSGGSSRVRPNEAMHFEGLRRAKDSGHRFYDFDGIHLDAARAVQRDGALPDDVRGVAHFKLGFGGEVAIFPGALDISPNRLVRPLVRAVAPRSDRLLGLAHRALGRGG
jgi:lipid II:glycine glycyltransferase (peptidoglycan interpeptide bridge formation enzyme)